VSDLELCDLLLARWKASNEAWRSQCEHMIQRHKEQITEMRRFYVFALVGGLLSGISFGIAIVLWGMR
jgi:hypothetical protein